MLARSKLPEKQKAIFAGRQQLLTQQKKRQKHTRITTRQN